MRYSIMLTILFILSFSATSEEVAEIDAKLHASTLINKEANRASSNKQHTYTEEIPEGYAIDSKNLTLYFEGKPAYKVTEKDVFFVCLDNSDTLKRDSGTHGLQSSTRIFPENCAYQGDLMYGADINRAAWKVKGDKRVFFILERWGGGNSSSSMSYKAIGFIDGKKTSKTDYFYPGEYFRFFGNSSCVILGNEYNMDEHIVLTGACKNKD